MQEGYARIYGDLYRRHWWWRSREAILVRLIHSLGFRPPIEILDVGCGGGYFFAELDRLGSVRGIEVDESLLADDCPARDRIYSKPLGDPFYRNRQFDLITALDVIEHIEDDGKAVDDMLAMLRPGGKMVITVPAFMALWDHHDDINNHLRRYTAGGLRRLLSPRGKILRLRYLFHGIVFLKLLVKLVNRGAKARIIQHRIPSGIVNRAMIAWCLAEYRWLRWLRIPFGTSVLAVLEKPSDPPSSDPL